LSEIDVLLPIRGANPRWLVETLESIAAQVRVSPRVVAVLHPDDGALAQIVESATSPVTIVEAPKEGHLAHALNAGLKACRAPFVARIDADDLAAPERLARQRQLLESSPTTVAVGSCASLIDEDSQVVGRRGVPTTSAQVLRRMRWRNALVHSSVMFRRESVLDVGGYSTVAENVEDYELWLRLLALGSIESFSEDLVSYRIHDAQLTKTRAISPVAAGAIRDARIDLARKRGESELAAALRQESWWLRQLARAHRIGA
jgi:GT2 family glycosyltransferase